MNLPDWLPGAVMIVFAGALNWRGLLMARKGRWVEAAFSWLLALEALIVLD